MWKELGLERLFVKDTYGDVFVIDKYKYNKTTREIDFPIMMFGNKKYTGRILPCPIKRVFPSLLRNMDAEWVTPKYNAIIKLKEWGYKIITLSEARKAIGNPLPEDRDEKDKLKKTHKDISSYFSQIFGNDDE